MAPASVAQVGRVAVLVQVAAVPLVVRLLLAASWKTPDCQVAPFQYLLSLLRCRVKVALLAGRPLPPLLSATLPLKLVGTVAVRRMLPVSGAVTEAMAGTVSSRVKETALPLKAL